MLRGKRDGIDVTRRYARMYGLHIIYKYYVFMYLREKVLLKRKGKETLKFGTYHSTSRIYVRTLHVLELIKLWEGSNENNVSNVYYYVRCLGNNFVIKIHRSLHKTMSMSYLRTFVGMVHNIEKVSVNEIL